MLNENSKKIDVSGCDIKKKCHNCKKVTKIVSIEPEHLVIHPITGDAFTNKAYYMCQKCNDEYTKFMEDMLHMSLAYDELDEEFDSDVADIGDPIVIEFNISHCSLAFV